MIHIYLKSFPELHSRKTKEEISYSNRIQLQSFKKLVETENGFDIKEGIILTLDEDFEDDNSLEFLEVEINKEQAYLLAKNILTLLKCPTE